MISMALTFHQDLPIVGIPSVKSRVNTQTSRTVNFESHEDVKDFTTKSQSA